MNHISLFSGIGGFDYAAEQVGWNNIAHCEINEFCLKILKYYWPNAQTHTDIKTTDFTVYRGKCDILTGGFPCQGNSVAGKRLGTEDDRYLWPEYLRAIDECQPTWVCGENVTGIVSMEDKSGIYRDVFAKVEGRKITRFCEVDKYEAVYTRQRKMLINSICESLEERGYEVKTFAIPAAAVQAPHARERIWFIAYASGNGYKLRGFGENKYQTSKSEGIRYKREWFWPNVGRTCQSEPFTNTNSQRLSQRLQPGERCFPCKTIGATRCKSARNITAANGWSEFPTQSPICSGNDGFPTELDRITFSKWRNESIKGAGNAIVPEVVLQIFRAIEQFE